MLAECAIILVIIIAFIIALVLSLFNGLLFAPVVEHVWSSDIPHTQLLVDGRISAWHFNSNYSNNGTGKTILFCHGNTGNISHRDYVIELCSQYHVNLLIFDYSGYGKSKGYPSQGTLFSDGVRVYNYLRETVDPENIIIWGESLGGAVATHIASHAQQEEKICSHLVLMSTFSSLDDIVFGQSSPLYFRLAMHVLSRTTDMMQSKYRIQQVKCPIIIVHSQEDDIIPYSNAIQMYNAITHDEKEFITICGGHSSPKMSREQLLQVFDFCNIKTDDKDVNVDRILEMLRNIGMKHCARKEGEFTRWE